MQNFGLISQRFADLRWAGNRSTTCPDTSGHGDIITKVQLKNFSPDFSISPPDANGEALTEGKHLLAVVFYFYILKSHQKTILPLNHPRQIFHFYHFLDFPR